MIENIKLQYENNGNKSFAIYSNGPKDALDSVELEMLRLNDIKGILPFNLMRKDDVTEFRYDITSRLSLEYMLRTQMSKEQIFKTFEEICLCMENAEDYLLDLNHFIVDMKCVYVDPGNGQVSFLYIPADCEDVTDISFSDFLKKLLSGITYDVKDDTDFYVNTINYLNSTRQIIPKVLRNKMYEFMKIVKQRPEDFMQPSPQKDAKQEPLKPAQPGVQQEQADISGGKNDFVIGRAMGSKDGRKEAIKKEQPNQQIPQKQENLPFQGKTSGDFVAPQPQVKEKKEKKPLFGKRKKEKKKMEPVQVQVAPEVILPPPVPRLAQPEPQPMQPQPVQPQPNMVDEIGGTMLLEEAPVYNGAYLESRKTGERILITKDAFAIGRNPAYVDYAINSPTVGRLHLQIISRDGAYFIVDVNSKNGTFINKNRISSNTEEPVHNGDSVQIGAEEFYFYCD